MARGEDENVCELLHPVASRQQRQQQQQRAGASRDINEWKVPAP
jgi:hypothetical protein